MSDIRVEVRTNVDSLDAAVIHHSFVRLVDEFAEAGGEILKATVPKGETLQLEHHSGHSPAHETADGIEAAVGVTAILDAIVERFQTGLKDFAVPGEQSAANSPIFVDRGTGIFGPSGAPIFARRSHFMKFEGEQGHDIFRQQTQGQPGQHFMLKTYAEMRGILPAMVEAFKTRLEAELRPKPLQ